MKTRAVLGAAVVLVAAGAWWLVARRGGTASGTDAVETHVVERGEVELFLKETGTVRPRQSVAVKSKVSGRVRSVLVAEGETVTSGQLVAVVEPDAQASLTLSQKRLELRRLRIDLDQKERDFRRQSRLAAEGLVSGQVAELAERDFRSAENLFLQERTALNLLEREANQPVTGDLDGASCPPEGLTDYRILAPITGTVSSVKVKPGEMATSGTTGFSQEGALLMEIADERELEVVVNVNEIDVAKVRPGMEAEVTLAGRPGAPIAARIHRVAVAPYVDPREAAKAIVYPVALKLPERPPELRQGMTATVDLLLERRASVVRVPVLAVSEREGKTVVRLKEGAAFLDRAVTLGLRTDRFAEVTAGLSPGDVVASRYPSEPPKVPAAR